MWLRVSGIVLGAEKTDATHMFVSEILNMYYSQEPVSIAQYSTKISVFGQVADRHAVTLC